MSKDLDLGDEESHALALFHLKNFLTLGFLLPDNFDSLDILTNNFMKNKDSLIDKDIDPVQQEVFIAFREDILEIRKEHPDFGFHKLLLAIQSEHPFLGGKEFNTRQ